MAHGLHPVSTNLSLLLSLSLPPSPPLSTSCTRDPPPSPRGLYLSSSPLSLRWGKETINDQQIKFLLCTASSLNLSPTVYVSVINHVHIYLASSWLQVPLAESLVESFWGRAVLAKHSNHLEAGREGYLAARKLDHLSSQAHISPQHDRWQAEGTACRGFMLNNQSAAQSWGEVFLMGDTLQKLDGYQEWTNKSAVSQG
ncbi:unnamed protein product [Gadus morhua 'NCC']